MLHVILLAAGRGTRMGGPNKLLLPLGASTVLQTTLEALLAADLGPVTVVTGHERDALLPVLAQYPVREVFNPDYVLGMTTSIQAGVRAVAGGEGYVVALSDMPAISAGAYRHLGAAFREQLMSDPWALALPRFGDSKGNPAVFAAAYREALLAHTEPEGCKGLVQANAKHVRWVPMSDDGVLRDVDTPDDYAKL